MPDYNKITATNTVILDLPYLPMEIRKAHVFEQLENAFMLISELCNHGYISVFDRDKVTIIKYYNIIMQGKRHKKPVLWMIDLTQKQPQKRKKIKRGKKSRHQKKWKKLSRHQNTSSIMSTK